MEYKAVIALTSWSKRIKFLYAMLKHLIKQIGNCYRVVITLSDEEFTNREKDLPDDLINFITNHSQCEILWVHNNCKSFKKILFAMSKYRNLPIIGCDDDSYCKFNYADILYTNWINNTNSVITMVHKSKFNVNGNIVYSLSGACTIYPPSSLLHLLNYIENEDILSTNNDDSLYGCYCSICGIPIKYLNYNIEDVFDFKNSIEPLTYKIKSGNDFQKDKEIIYNALKSNQAPYGGGLSVCISAYKAKYYLKDTLDSIITQDWFNHHDNYEILIGIDGCIETEEYVKTIMNDYSHLHVYLMDKNYGTYVTSNTLFKQAIYNNIIRFDSDDIMRHNMITSIMLNKDESGDVYTYNMKNFGDDNKVGLSIGSFLIKRNTFLKFGGFQPWKCASDSEFQKRTYKFLNTGHINDILFDRRVHNNSLTRTPGEWYCFNGSYGSKRTEKIKYVENLNINNEEDAIIDLKTGVFTEITNNITEKLIVTMTSWPKRITNIPIVIDSILNQTLVPDEIVINLSEVEFQNRNLPDSVRLYLSAHSDKVHIQWLKGDNCRQWKKILPTFITHPHDSIVCIDDDAVYPKDMLETLWNCHKKHPNNPIGGTSFKLYNTFQHCGTCNLDKFSYYRNIFTLLDNEIIKMNSSDTFFSYVAQKNNNMIYYCGRDFGLERNVFNEYNPITKPNNHDCEVMREYLENKYGKL